MHPLLNIAIQAARKAGQIQTRALEQIELLKVKEKAPDDFVTVIDQQSEELIIKAIRKSYPTHRILGEETGEHSGDDEWTWIIDPLDGTANFIRQFPYWAISIGIAHQGKLEHAVVYEPISQELFTATRGRGAQLNNRRIRVSQTLNLRHTTLGVGLACRDRKQLPSSLKVLTHLSQNCHDVRRMGACALDLAYVAAGRLDGCFEVGIQPWDVAAGLLLVQEAGGYVGCLDEDPKLPLFQQSNVIAANRKIFPPLKKNIIAAY